MKEIESLLTNLKKIKEYSKQRRYKNQISLKK